MAENIYLSPRLVLLALLLPTALHAIDSDTKQCDADQATSCGSEAGHNEFTRYEKFEDIPQDIVERAHLRELGSHREADAEVEVLDYMISSEDFYERHVARHKPVVLKNVAKRWPATKLWTDEYLKEKHGNMHLNMETRDDDKWNAPRSRTIGEFLNAYETANLYLVDEVPPAMRKDVVIPECLRCTEIVDRFYLSYFWMSTGGTSSSLHIDTDENLLTVIQGKKDVVLISPKYSRDVYADEARVLGVSEVNVSAVDLKKFPRVANVRYITAHLEAGDALYLPQMWWHYVYSPKMRQQAVAMWWKSIPPAKDSTKTSASFSRRRSDAERSSEQRLASLARWLEDYISYIDDLDENTNTRPACKNEEKFMSDHNFETDKVNGWSGLAEGLKSMSDPMEGLPEARASTKKVHLEKDSNDSQDVNSVPEFAFGDHMCYFDRNNPESPCFHIACGGATHFPDIKVERDGGTVDGLGERVLELEGGGEVKAQDMCTWHVIDYCSRFVDRGCAIELPQLLNKKRRDDIRELAALKGKIVKP